MVKSEGNLICPLGNIIGHSMHLHYLWMNDYPENKTEG